LTGFYNKRGFHLLADQQWKLAQRKKRGFHLFLLDLDHLKKINDTFGHVEGDWALSQAADILRLASRKSDILARIGGDEFALITIDTDRDNLARFLENFYPNLNDYNSKRPRSYDLSLSLGAAYLDPQQPLPVEADRAMYENKKDKTDYQQK
jgi:diguanylate cyclase (GGDEF)-like protein